MRTGGQGGSPDDCWHCVFIGWCGDVSGTASHCRIASRGSQGVIDSQSYQPRPFEQHGVYLSTLWPFLPATCFLNLRIVSNHNLMLLQHSIKEPGSSSSGESSQNLCVASADRGDIFTKHSKLVGLLAFGNFHRSQCP